MLLNFLKGVAKLCDLRSSVYCSSEYVLRLVRTLKKIKHGKAQKGTHLIC